MTSAQIAVNVFGLSHTHVSCNEKTSLDDFTQRMLVGHVGSIAVSLVVLMHNVLASPFHLTEVGRVYGRQSNDLKHEVSSRRLPASIFASCFRGIKTMFKA